MRRSGALSIVFLSVLAPAVARHGGSFCGTTAETANETLFVHRQAMRARAARGLQMRTAAAPSLNRDIGNIAIIEDADGVVARVNQFNLDGYTLRFTPNGARYAYSATNGGYDSTAAAAGTPLAALDDDDSRLMPLPFAFPFFGATYNQVFVNSDGNLTFTSGDNASTDRSLGRATSGPPRIFPLFDDLDPAQTAGGVRLFADSTHAVVSWAAVPEYASTGVGKPQTFQVRLYNDGRVEFSYSGISAGNAVVGISPGASKGSTTIVSFRNDPSGNYTAAVAERFGNSLVVDSVTAAQKFYQTHDDAYDYLIVFNNMGIGSAGPAGTIALTNIVRSTGAGYGLEPRDVGLEYGSASRLQAVIDGGPLKQYPKDPNAVVPARTLAGDTPLSILSHETGHLFLAFASVADPDDPSVHPMLGYGNVHWSFVFNSEASFLEGEKIVDRGSTASPQFLTTDTVQHYSPLDQYLMGFAPAKSVDPIFYVTGVLPSLPTMHPQSNYAFDGTRRNISVDDVIQASGRRTPDYTVAQRRFRFAFIMVVAQGTQPSADDLAQVDAYRQQFEPYYSNAASNNAFADTTLRKSLKLSLYPNAGVVLNTAGTATVAIQNPLGVDLTVKFQTPNAIAKFPDSVTIPAGETSATFTYQGIQEGVEEVQASIDPSYETAYARLQVAGKSLLKIVPVSGDHQVAAGSAELPDPIVVRLTDANNLPYRGARIVATASTGGIVNPPFSATDTNGQVSFRWTPGGGRTAQLLISADSVLGVSLTLNAGSTLPVAGAVVNAATFTEGLAAGSIQTVSGVNLAGGQSATASLPWPTTGLAGVRVLLNNTSLPVLYVSDTQINFYLPQNTPVGSAMLTVMTPSGTPATVAVNVIALAPGIFPGAVVRAGTFDRADLVPVQAGDYLEIYCTGLGPTRDVAGLQRTTVTPVVFIGSTPVTPIYSGLAPGYVGLYQVNVQVPAGLAPGIQTLLMSVSLAHSNQVQIKVQ